MTDQAPYVPRHTPAAPAASNPRPPGAPHAPGGRPVPASTAPARSLRIGRFFGVPLYLAPSWLVIAAFVTVSFAELFRTAVTGATGATPFLLVFAFAVLSAVSVLLHELGHTSVALLLGLRVRRVYIFLLGGVSELDPEPRRPRDELLVSAAGPVTSAALAGASWVTYLAADAGTALSVEMAVLTYSNLVIAVFNALPGLPLDGGRVLRAALWAASRSRVGATRVASWSGRILALLVAGSGLLIDRAGWGVASTVLTVALGAFLWLGASQSLSAARLTDRLPTVAVSALVRRAVWVPADLPVSEALRRLWEQQARAIVVVDAADTPRAIAEEARVTALAPQRRPWTPIGALARPLVPEGSLPAELAGEALLAAYHRSPAPEYLVTGPDGRPVGVLAAADLREALSRSDQGRKPAGAAA